MDKFDSKIEWDKKSKLCKIFVKRDKNNNPYFLGELTRTQKILIQKNTGQFAKEGEYQIYLVPVIYKKVESGSGNETLSDMVDL